MLRKPLGNRVKTLHFLEAISGIWYIFKGKGRNINSNSNVAAVDVKLVATFRLKF